MAGLQLVRTHQTRVDLQTSLVVWHSLPVPAYTMAMGGFHFVTGEFTSHKSFLPDEEYARGLDNFVKGCSDMLVTNRCGACRRSAAREAWTVLLTVRYALARGRCSPASAWCIHSLIGGT